MPSTDGTRRPGAGRPRLDVRYARWWARSSVLVAMFVIGGIRYENFLTGAVISNLFINNAFLIVSPSA